MEAVANATDADLRALYQEKLATEQANIRTWEAERAAVEAEATKHLAEMAEGRDVFAAILARADALGAFTVAQRRKLAVALNLRVNVFRPEHHPWFEMAGNLAGIEASWHAERLWRARTDPDWLGLALDFDDQRRAQVGETLLPPERRSPQLLVPLLDVPAQLSEGLVSETVLERMASHAAG